MGEALGAADEVVVLDVYLAREDADPGVTGALVADAVPLPPDAVVFVPDFAAVPAAARRPGPSGDLVLTLGAGDVTQVGPGCWSCSRSGADASPLSAAPGGHGEDPAERRPGHARARSGSRAGSGRAAGSPGSPSSRCCSCSASPVGSVWAVFFSSWLAVKGSR